MPGERLSMRKISELPRLRWEQHLPQRVITNRPRLSQASVSDYLSRARRAGLTRPLPDGLDDVRLEALLFPLPPDVPFEQPPVPDWSAVHRWRCCGRNTARQQPTASVTRGSAICIASGPGG